MSSLEQRNELYNSLYEDRRYDYGDLYGYHSMSPLWDCSVDTLYRFGFEAEKEDSKGQIIAQVYQGHREDLLPHKFRAERDGSLGSYGFELISPIYDLMSMDYYEHLSNPILNFLIHSDTTYRCGGHVTISKKGATSDYYKAKAEQIIPLLYALYPKRAKMRGYSKFFKRGDYNERYNAINLMDDRMEIRIFSGIKNLKQLKWRIELLRILFSNPYYEELKWDTIYKDLLNINSNLGGHIHSLYKNKYGEKVMLAAAYRKAYMKEAIAWQEFSRVGKLIPTTVRHRLTVHPQPNRNINSKQLTLDVCDYSQERTGEA